MGVQIVPKGQSVPMRGANAIVKGRVGLGWSVNAGQSTEDFDLDGAIVARDAGGDVVEVCYYGNLQTAWATHHGDNLTGAGDGDDEVIDIDFDLVPANIHSLDVMVIIYEGAARGQYFGMVEDAFVRIENPLNPQTGNALRTELSNENALYKATGVVIARFVRSGPSWDFVAAHDADARYASLTSACQAVVPV